jgi:enoyl-CoA hydratase
MSRYESFERLRAELSSDGVLDLVCHFIGERNLYDEKAHQELGTIWPVISKDPEVRVVVLRGHAGVLGGGGTPEMIANCISSWPRVIEAHQEARDIVMGVIECTKPVITAIEGAALGGALAAAMVSDITVAGDNAKIVDPHTMIGLVAGDGAAIIWPLLCGMARTKLALMTGRRIKGKDAAEMGLVSLSVPDDEVVEKAFELARNIAAQPLAAMRWTKHALNGWLRMATPIFDHSLALEYVTMMGDDFKEKMNIR